MRTSAILSIAAALAAAVVASSDDASARSRGDGDRGPQSVSVRDHRVPKVVNIRDHRAPKTVSVRQESPKFTWVQKKGEPGHWERARAEAKSVPIVRDHRKPATPVVRDHRTAAPVVRDHRATVREGQVRPAAAKKVAPRPLYNHSMSMGGR